MVTLHRLPRATLLPAVARQRTPTCELAGKLCAMRLDNLVVAAVLRSPAHQVLSRSTILLRYQGRKSGREYTIPVQYAVMDGQLLLYAMNAENKQWWRNLSDADVDVLLRGTWRGAHARIVRGDADLARRYRERFRWTSRQINSDPNAVFVMLTLSETVHAAT